MLFKVERCTGVSFMSDGSFRVKRVCDEASVVEQFNPIVVESTPFKVYVHINFICFARWLLPFPVLIICVWFRISISQLFLMPVGLIAFLSVLRKLMMKTLFPVLS